jgi:signal transduction histidine kinase
MQEKLSGDPYTDEDMRLLETFAYQAAIALEKARLYTEVKGYSSVLEQKVEERTEKVRELQEEQRHTMIDIAHGLQTPLTAMRIQLELFKKENPSLDQAFTSLVKSIDGVSALVYDLLKLSRLELTKETTSKEKINLSEMLTEFVEYIETLAEAEGITIKDSITPLIFVSGNKKELSTLATNLVSNSFKYMREDGQKMITISLFDKDNHACIVIADTGIGIDRPDLPKVFGRFYRARSEEINKTQGSGLGLAIAKKIVERHDGTISIDSEMNVGTRVTVCLPLQKA